MPVMSREEEKAAIERAKVETLRQEARQAMKAGVLDANVLRFFLQDDPKHSPAATDFLREAEELDIELFLLDAIRPR
jgi:hypothetical protein